MEVNGYEKSLFENLCVWFGYFHRKRIVYALFVLRICYMYYFFTAEGEFESVFTGMIPVKCEGLWNLGLLACVTLTHSGAASGRRCPGVGGGAYAIC